MLTPAETIARLETLVHLAETGDLYSDYDRGVKVVGEAREAVNTLNENLRNIT